MSRSRSPRLFLVPIVGVLLGSWGSAAGKAGEFPPQAPVHALGVADEARTFQLPAGYRLEPVLSEPEIKEPVAIAFDGNGRMFVAEMRSYMQEIDGKDELTTASKVSLHWSSKGDGVLDKHTVFADHLKLPRMILPLGKGELLIGETDTNDIYLYKDTDGDGISDKKDLWYAGGPRGGNLEHQPSGLVWSIDNWIYTTYNTYRLRWTPQGPVKAASGANNGQWGLGQDDFGHLFFVNAGGEQGPQSFQVPVAYGGFNPKKQFSPGFEEVWPLVGLADVQGGPSRARPSDKTLNHVTSSAGIEVFRGDQLPAELRGNLFFGEPVGRLVRRAKIESQEGLTVLTNPYQAEHSEFLRSTDPCFRPVNIANAPDGTLYIVDMYRGIIQEGNWVREGSYLRKVVEQYQMDKVAGHGRIWRLVHDSTKPVHQPRMYEETAAQLVGHFGHANGWWRDTAQKLLILRQDRSVVPALQAMARSGPAEFARLHALWTLEGLNAVDPTLVQNTLKDADPKLRNAAIRVSEALLQKGGLLPADASAALIASIQNMTGDPDPGVALQAFLTERLLDLPGWRTQLATYLSKNPPSGVKEIAGPISNPPPPEVPTAQLTPEHQKLLAAGADAFKTLCATCHGPDAKGLPMQGAAPGAMLAPPLAGSKTVTGHSDGMIKVLLNGLTGEIEGKKYEGTMVSMSTNNDAWIASVVSYVRQSFGNHASFVSEKDVARVRLECQARTQPWVIPELRSSLPQVLANRKEWKVSASHHSPGATLAIDGDLNTRFETGSSQVPGMWYQVELPQETSITGLLLDSTPSPHDYPRGFKVEVSNDGKTWGQPIASGKGDSPVTEILFDPVKARFIKITQTGAVSGLFWSIHELQVYGSPGKVVASRN